MQPLRFPGSNSSVRAAFTLIELLVVIAIIAILAIVVVLTLNPAQILQKSRDANRLSDMQTLDSAVNLYIEDAATGGNTLNLGSSSITYLSLVDPTATSSAGTNCTALGFPAGYFHCAGPQYYRRTDGTGWIPINFTTITSGNPISQLPVDPTNNASSGLYYSYQTNGSTWKVAAEPESQNYASQIASFTAGNNPNLLGGFPQGWVTVPGNSSFGTSNFAVMKYDASCMNLATGQALTTPLDGNGYKDNSSSTTHCDAQNGFAPTSQATGYPIVDVSETSIKTYCAQIGAHLMTNDEYMTIDTNAANQGTNWYGDTVGTNYVYSGHNDDSPNQASVASPNDSQNCVGTNGPSSCGGTGTNSSQIRTYTLSNGSVIWDMAGNLWQEVQRSSKNVGDNTNTITPPTCSNGTAGWEWCQYNSTAPYVTTWNDSSFNAATVAPPNGAWGSSQDMGQLSTYGSGANQNTTAFLRGGSFNNGPVDGPFTLNLGWYTDTTGSAVGFRCAR